MPADPGAGGPPPDIVLVEDNPRDAELTLRALGRADPATRVVVARDGQEALDLLLPAPPGAPVRPRLVLLDLKLPKVPGLDVLRALKAQAATRCIPVAVLTSSSMERDVRECYEAGANSYLRKPVDFAEFTECARLLGAYWLRANEVPP